MTYGSGKNFLYRFDADTEHSYFKHVLTKTTEYKGACHADEVCHFLKCDKTVFKDFKFSSIDGVGFKTTKNLVNFTQHNFFLIFKLFFC